MNIQIPGLIAIIIIFILWLNYEIYKTSNTAKKETDRFWKREKSSNTIRRKDISSLNYIIISTNRLPMGDNPDDTVNSYRDIILSLAGKKAVNLRGFTNTELKLNYGTANINALSEYDNNFITLVSILHKWAERLYIKNDITDCISVLEYAVACNTDVSNSYIRLAELYKLTNTPDKIDDLIAYIPNTKLLNKDYLIRILNTLRNA